MKKSFIIFDVIILVILLLAYNVGLLSPVKDWKEVSGFNEVSKNQKIQFYQNDQIGIKWLGHGGFYLNWKGKTILFDPILSEYCKIIPRQINKFVEPEELPPIDFLLLSHMHYDHMDLETIEKLAKVKQIVIPKGSTVFFPDQIKNSSTLVELAKNEHIDSKNFKITAVTAIHNGARNHPFHSKYFALGYVISDGETTLYFSGDTGYGEHFKEIKEKFHPTISILPIRSFKPYFVLKDYHLSPEDAVKAAIELGSKINIPSHFGTFRLALDPLDMALPNFVEVALERDVPWQLAKPYNE